MNRYKIAIFIAAITLVAVGCSDDDNPVNNGGGDDIPEVYQNLPGTLITSDTTWSGTLTLTGQHYVLPGVTLTIEAGTTVEWEFHNNNVEDVGVLITLPADPDNFVEGPQPSGKLIAEGTASNPIVFTSARSPKQPGDWGGIIMIGEAPNNLEGGKGEVEGLPQNEALQYGGDNPSDDSGSLQYVRIEYVGFGLTTDSEVNGLSLYSVGNQTTLEHIQVYKCTDDGFEFFGGTVNSKYLVSMFNDDDSFDLDEGSNGSHQFWLAVQTGGADNGFEMDGRKQLGFGDESNPTIFNVTLVGLKQSGAQKDANDNNYGMRLREDFTGFLSNFIITDFDGFNFKLEGEDDGTASDEDKTFENYDPQNPASGALALQNLMLFNNDGWNTGDDTRYAGSYTIEDPGYQDAANFDYRPGNANAANGATPPSDGFFDTGATYYGAFDPSAVTAWIFDGNWVRTSDN